MQLEITHICGIDLCDIVLSVKRAMVNWPLTYGVQVIFPTFWNDECEITHSEPVLAGTGE